MSNVSFQEAIDQGVARANKTLKNVKGAWVKDQEVTVDNGKARFGMMGVFTEIERGTIQERMPAGLARCALRVPIQRHLGLPVTDSDGACIARQP